MAERLREAFVSPKITKIDDTTYREIGCLTTAGVIVTTLHEGALMGIDNLPEDRVGIILADYNPDAKDESELKLSNLTQGQGHIGGYDLFTEKMFDENGAEHN